MPNASCHECNHRLSREFEQSVAEQFTDFRRLLLIPDRRGNLPEVAVTVELNGEVLDAKLMPNGHVQLKPVVTQVKADGVTEVVFQHVTERMKQTLRSKAAEQGFDLVEETAPEQSAEVNIAGDLNFLDSAQMLRAVTKIAYTALALRMGTQFAMRDIFAAAHPARIQPPHKPQFRSSVESDE